MGGSDEVVGRWQEMSTALADIYLFPAKPTPANFWGGTLRHLHHPDNRPSAIFSSKIIR